METGEDGKESEGVGDEEFASTLSTDEEEVEEDTDSEYVPSRAFELER